MEKIVKKMMIPKYIEVQSDEFKDVVVYKTIDGLEFKKEAEAILHESKLIYTDIPVIDFDIFPISEGRWYKPTDQKEVDSLIVIFKNNAKISEEHIKKIHVGEWINAYYDYGGDSCPDRYVIFTKDEFLRRVDELLERLI